MRQRIDGGTAFLSGVIAGSTMPLIMLLFPQVGATANPSIILGSWPGWAPSGVTSVFGFLVFLVIAGLIALVYATGFELLGRADWETGMAFAVVHMLIGALAASALPAVHPLMPGELPAPGAFFWNIKHGPFAFVALHLVYGALVGAIYRIETAPRVHRDWSVMQAWETRVER